MLKSHLSATPRNRYLFETRRFGPFTTRRIQGVIRYRATVLVALARVARAALATQKQLMLRVVYRNKRKSASRTENAAPKKR